MFSSGGQLVFMGEQNVLNWTSLCQKRSSRKSNQEAKITLLASQFAQWLNLKETTEFIDVIVIP